MENIEYLSKTNLQEYNTTFLNEIAKNNTVDVLYSSSSGTNSSLTFNFPQNKSLSNYQYLEIVYAKLENGACGYNTIKVPAVNRTVTLWEFHMASRTSNVNQLLTSVITITDTGISFDRCATHFNIQKNSSATSASSGAATWNNFNAAGNDQYIYKVIGINNMFMGKKKQS